MGGWKFTARQALAITLFLSSASVWAVDTDGDGVDDAVDAFPANAEASVDTDSDGMPDVVNLDVAAAIFTDQFGTGTFTAGGWTTSGSWSLSNAIASTSQSCIPSTCSVGNYATLTKQIVIPAGGGKLFFYASGNQGSSAINIGAWGTILYIGNNVFTVPAGNQTVSLLARTGVFTGSYSLNISAVVIRASSLVQDADDDNDGIVDVYDQYPIDDTQAGDTDGDGIDGFVDNCLDISNSDQLNADGDAQGNACDTDDDNDSILDAADNCPVISNVNQLDSDGDGVGSVCDADPYAPTFASAVAANRYSSCALTAAGGVKCWGRNSNGQLGDNTTTSRSRPVDVVGLSSGVSAIAVGENHACALTAAGGVKCWGYNTSGQLGDNTLTQRLTPVDVVGLTSGVSAIAAGGSTTCALTTAEGMKCWGSNGYGRLGDNTGASQSTPVDVVGLTSGVSAIALGDFHTCALTTTGAVKCWGYNYSGQIGDNTTTNRSTPVDVVGLTSGVSAIALGGHHTCALTTIGAVKCWGANGSGNLGDNSFTNRLTPVDVVGLISGVNAIAAGGDHTCALTTVGGMKCWGWNYYGQLGDNSGVNRTSPVDVVGLTSGVSAIAVGSTHTCALTTANGIKCWGQNNAGMLGDNTTLNRSTPVDVIGFMGDSDDDGVVDPYDNCVSTSNQDQLNADGASDGGNACDWDDDNDGVPDNIDAAPLNAGDTSEITLPLDGGYNGLRLEGRQQGSP